MADAIVTPCTECVKCVGPQLKKHLYDFNENVVDFQRVKSALKARKYTYDQELERATIKKELPTRDVESWIQEYEAIIRKCELPEYNEDELERKKRRRRYTIKRYKFSRKLVKMTTEVTKLINGYNGFHSLFVEDLVSKNDDILKNFEDTKKKFDDTIETYEEHKFSAVKNHKIPTKLVSLWIANCEMFRTKYGDGNTEIQVEGESSHRQGERIWQMKEMEDLIIQYHQFNGVTNMFVDQPLETVEKRSTVYKPLDSMENYKKTIYAALEDEMVIRLFGAGGIGKTTLMQQINEEMSHQTNFKLVIWVTVSTTYADIKDIQYQICQRLDLKRFDCKDNTVRAAKISEYLKNNVDGSTLFIFDDVWDSLDLKKIGIPCGTYGNDGRKCCKIILTTRDRDVKVIHQMPPKNIEMKGLDEAESWILFKINASIEDEDNLDDGIKELAEKICRKCAGLPLVITAIAKMLYREKKEFTWFEILTFLNKTDSSLDIPDIRDNYLKKVYVPLKLSYDCLGRKDLKIGFLLCSLFPEDCEIAVTDLFYYGIGAGEIAKSFQSLHACRNIFIHLKNKGLLQDVEGDDSSARMHDVFRDVAHIIAKDEFDGFFCNAELTKWISSVQNSSDRPENVKEMKFQSLFGNKKVKIIHLDDISVGLENVLLLDLRRTSIELDSAMLYIKKLKKLRVLMFGYSYREIPVNIKEYFILHKLSVLCLHRVHIKELDKEFSKKLCNLRVIDFLETKIDVIRPKAFSYLHNKLEVLCLAGSFSKWQASDEEDGEFASFAELAELKKLYSLQVDIDDKDIFSHEYRPDLVFSSVGCFSINSFHYYKRWNTKALDLPPQRLVKNGANWIKDLLKKTEHLTISQEEEYLQNDNGGTEVDVVLTYDIIVNHICHLEILVLEYFQTCKYAIQYSSNEEGNHSTSKPILPKAKELCFSHLFEMENIFVSTTTPTVIPKGSFGKLQSIGIYECPMLKFIFPWNVAPCLVQLHSLEIGSCGQLEVIVEKEDNRDCNQGAQVLFPELTEMSLSFLPKLECVSTLTPTVIPKGSYQKLQSIEIMECPRLKFIFPWNVATSLVQLQSLEIKRCDQLEVIVEKEGRDCDQGERGLFPELTNMELYYLPKLEYVDTLIPTVIPKGSLQKLQSIVIWGCPTLKFIFPWNVATCLVQLHSLVIGKCYQLEVIVEKEGRDCDQGAQVLFPKLTEMDLRDLPKLEYVPSGSDEKLENLKQRWLLGENSAPKLKCIEWDETIFED